MLIGYYICPLQTTEEDAIEVEMNTVIFMETPLNTKKSIRAATDSKSTLASHTSPTQSSILLVNANATSTSSPHFNATSFRTHAVITDTTSAAATTTLPTTASDLTSADFPATTQNKITSNESIPGSVSSFDGKIVEIIYIYIVVKINLLI